MHTIKHAIKGQKFFGSVMLFVAHSRACWPFQRSTSGNFFSLIKVAADTVSINGRVYIVFGNDFGAGESRCEIAYWVLLKLFDCQLI